MTKTILIGSHNIFSNRTSQVIYGIIGISYLIFGISKIYRFGISFEAVGFTLISVCFLVFDIFYFTNTPLTPKVQIDDDKILWRSRVFGAVNKLSWTKILSIEFQSYEIHFQMNGERKTLQYQSNAHTSLEIKRSLREMAEKRNIEVIGG